MSSSTTSSSSQAKSTLAPTSTPLIDDYMLVRKTDLAVLKDVVETKSVNRSTSSGTRSYGGAQGAIRLKVNYDFKITPSTVDPLGTYVAVSAFDETQVAQYWKNLFQYYTIHQGFIELDFHEYANMVGTADKFSSLGWSYRPTTSQPNPGFGQISDDQNFRFINWSSAKPVVRFNISKKMLKDVGFIDGASQSVSESRPTSKWCPLSQNWAMGYVHIASFEKFNAGTTGRAIIGRLVLDCTFKGRK
jgi:hypothetical protein